MPYIRCRLATKNLSCYTWVSILQILHFFAFLMSHRFICKCEILLDVDRDWNSLSNEVCTVRDHQTWSRSISHLRLFLCRWDIWPLFHDQFTGSNICEIRYNIMSLYSLRLIDFKKTWVPYFSSVQIHFTKDSILHPVKYCWQSISNLDLQDFTQHQIITFFSSAK